MKKQRVWANRILAGIMALACFVGSSAPLTSLAASSTTTATISETDSGDDVIYYAALGDSITAGSNTYVDKVSDYLEQKHGNCTTFNLAGDGWMSGDLLDALTNPLNIRYSTFQAVLKEADYITLDIGSNDLLLTVMGIVSAGLGCSPDQLQAVTTEWAYKFNTLQGMELFMLGLKALSMGYKLNYELNYGTTLPNAIAQFESNYKEIVSVIEKIAPNAKLYIGNLYNPYVKAASIYLGTYEAVNVEKLARTYILKMNKIIANNASGNVVVDLYNTINNPKYIKGDVANFDYDPHPNAAGHAAIAAKFIAAMK